MSTTVCIECNSEVPIGVMFCPECGVPVEAQTSRQDESLVPTTNAGEDLTNEVLKTPVEPTKDMAATVDTVMNSGNKEALNDLLTKIETMINCADAGKNEMLGDLITSISDFVETSEKIKNDMLTEMKEQNLLTLNSMQEVATSFSTEIRTAAEGIKEAQRTTLAEMTSIAQQVKAAAPMESSEGAGRSSGNSTLVYMGIIMLVFMSLNIIITAYIVRLTRGLY